MQYVHVDHECCKTENSFPQRYYIQACVHLTLPEAFDEGGVERMSSGEVDSLTHVYSSCVWQYFLLDSSTYC